MLSTSRSVILLLCSILALAGCGGGGGGSAMSNAPGGTPGAVDPGSMTPTSPINPGTGSPTPEGPSSDDPGSGGGGIPGGGGDPAADTMPDTFSFGDRLDVSPNTIVMSSSITISGINQPVPVTLAGASSCAASINGAPFSSAPTNPIQNGQQLVVQLVSATDFGAAQQCSVNVGNGSAMFSVTTRPGLVLSPSTLILGGDDGLGSLQQDVTVKLVPATGTQTFAATINATGNIPALSLDRSSGTVGASSDTIRVTADRRGMKGGVSQGSVTFSVQLGSRTVTQELPVQVNLPAHRLYVTDNGIGLATMPDITNLSGIVKVLDTYGFTTTPWSATSDQPWLTVTSSGVSGGNLSVVANPAGLQLDTVHYATVTVTSTDASIENQEKIRVGLWVGSAPSAAVNVNFSGDGLEVDPIRPFVYLSNNDRLFVYNIYTGALVTTILGVPFGSPVASTDGSRLYALGSLAGEVVPVDLDRRVPLQAFRVGSSAETQNIAFARIKGHDTLVTDNFNTEIFDVATGAVLGRWPSFGLKPQVSTDGSTVCGAALNIPSQVRFSCMALDYSELRGGVARATLFGESRVEPGARDFAVSHDGSRVYVGSGTSLVTYDTRTRIEVRRSSVPTNPGPLLGNIEVGPTGKIYYAAFPGGLMPDTWVEDTLGGNVGALTFAGGFNETISARSIRISGDGLRIVAFVSPGLLRVVTSP